MPTLRPSLAFVVTLTVLALNLTGCAMPLPPPPQSVKPPQAPPPPMELMEPPACGECSQSVLELFKRWRKLLTPTLQS